MTVLDRLRESGVVAVMRGVDPDSAVRTAEALRDGGVGAVELTMDAPNAAETLAALVAALDDTLVGAGTVMDASSAARAIDAGADFVVAPHLDTDVVETCTRRGTLVAPGVLTPTEAVRAVEAGADVCKVFPASTVGPDHLAALSGPLPQIPLMPTGGVGLDTVGDFLDAGAVCVGVGSALVDHEAVAAGDFEVIRDTAAAFAAEVDAARAD